PTRRPSDLVAVLHVLGISQIFGNPKGTRKITPPYLPILANQHVGQVGIVVVDQLVEHTHPVHLMVPGVRIRRRQFLLVALHFIHLDRQPPTERARTPFHLRSTYTGTKSSRPSNSAT